MGTFSLEDFGNNYDSEHVERIGKENFDEGALYFGANYVKGESFGYPQQKRIIFRDKSEVKNKRSIRYLNEIGREVNLEICLFIENGKEFFTSSFIQPPTEKTPKTFFLIIWQ